MLPHITFSFNILINSAPFQRGSQSQHTVVVLCFTLSQNHHKISPRFPRLPTDATPEVHRHTSPIALLLSSFNTQFKEKCQSSIVVRLVSCSQHGEAFSRSLLLACCSLLMLIGSSVLGLAENAWAGNFSSLSDSASLTATLGCLAESALRRY